MAYDIEKGGKEFRKRMAAAYKAIGMRTPAKPALKSKENALQKAKGSLMK